MRPAIKICGLTDPVAVAATAQAGADYAGFVFHASSPRRLDPASAAELVAALPSATVSVGLFVDADDAAIAAVLDTVPLRMLQLHGKESVARVVAIKTRFGLPVIKAIGIATAADLDQARAFNGLADMLLLDAAPRAGENAGGNARPFDWSVLRGFATDMPWLLAGGLDADHLGQAHAATRAPGYDVSSGVEDRPGIKNPDKIRTFVARARALATTS